MPPIPLPAFAVPLAHRDMYALRMASGWVACSWHLLGSSLTHGRRNLFCSQLFVFLRNENNVHKAVEILTLMVHDHRIAYLVSIPSYVRLLLQLRRLPHVPGAIKHAQKLAQLEQH